MGVMASDPARTVETAAPVVHDTTISEQGSFTRASCRSCGWSGPARRARSFAAVDVEEHRLLTGAAVDLRPAELSELP
jgi:hypothetical protein